MKKHLPLVQQFELMDVRLAQIIADLTELLDEHNEGQPYPWGHVEDIGGTADSEGL